MTGRKNASNFIVALIVVVVGLVLLDHFFVHAFF
jgi:hypothetical protein